MVNKNENPGNDNENFDKHSRLVSKTHFLSTHFLHETFGCHACSCTKDYK